jgi:hypothetical protein
MQSAADLWFSIITVLLFAVLLFLRSRFPDASRRSEAAVLTLATLTFFGLCALFLPHGVTGVR